MRLTLAGSKFKEGRAMTESSRESRSDQSGHFLDELRTTIVARANHEAVCFPERSTRDEYGFLTLVGRKNDLIITNGFNVYPQVVERVINACPGVQESIVVGVPDKRHGERVMAAVVRTDDTLAPQAVRVFLGDRLVDYQRPAEIVFITDLPRNPTGKVMRRERRDQLSASAD
jgi:acyl-CoA synthetase (AMP-forming)/AMP-acid ligase II